MANSYSTIRYKESFGDLEVLCPLEIIANSQFPMLLSDSMHTVSTNETTFSLLIICFLCIVITLPLLYAIARRNIVIIAFQEVFRQDRPSRTVIRLNTGIIIILMLLFNKGRGDFFIEENSISGREDAFKCSFCKQKKTCLVLHCYSYEYLSFPPQIWSLYIKAASLLIIN